MSSSRTPHPAVLIWRIVYGQRILFGAVWLIVTALGVGYALLSPKLWPVTTGLAIREETGSSQGRPGEFASTEARRKAQESVTQLAASTSVIRDALAQTTSAKYSSAPVISTDAIEQAQGRIRVAPPKGIDFGVSEVLYLTVKDEDPAAAEQFSRSLVAQIDLRLKEMRRKRTDSLASELAQSLQLAEAELSAALGKMATMEAALGSDLAEMRIMTEPSAGESNLRRTLTEVENELRQARAQLDGNRTLLELLEAARQDPSRLIATPSRLLDSQPSLRKMKDQIVEAENRTSQLRGNLHETHPKVKAAKVVEEQARQQLFTELVLAVEGVKVEIHVGETRLNELASRRNAIENRLSHLAELRTDYSQLAAQVKDQSETVKRARDQLAEVKSSRAAAETSSVLASVEAPAVGLRPDGPGRSLICLVGVVAGFVMASSVVVAVAPAAKWREVFAREDDHVTQRLDPEHGVLAAWIRNARPLQQERLTASNDPGHSTKS
jgi:polysaccharide biosynthesis transport protein